MKKINIDEKIIHFLNKIESLGYQAYVVGGYVRDLYIGKHSKDIDIATNADLLVLIENLKDLKFNKNSLHLGAISTRIDQYEIQITRFREDSSLANGRYPDSINYVDTIEQDYSRRDFTINALYADSKGNIIDLCNGIDDIKKGIIRTVIDPNVSFTQDYLRMIRALRFASTYDYIIEESTLHALDSLFNNCTQLSWDRIRQEFSKVTYSLGVNRYLNYWSQLISLKCKQDIQFKVLDHYYKTEVFFYAYQFANQSKDWIKFFLQMMNYPSRLANQVNEFIPFISHSNDKDSLIYQKRLAAINFNNELLHDLSVYTGLDLVDINDHLNRMDIVLRQKQIKCSTSDFAKLSIKPHEYKITYDFLLEALYLNKVKNNKDALMEYIKDNRIDLKKKINAS